MLPTHTTTSRQRFTPIEDMVIKNLAQNRQLSWDDIARQLPGRTGRQCRDRYNKYLTKFVVNKEWTEEEDNLIIQKYKELGPRWTQIAQFLEGRNGNNVKNRWYKYIIKRDNSITTTAPMPRKKKTEESSSLTNSEEESFDFTSNLDLLFMNNDVEFCF